MTDIQNFIGTSSTEGDRKRQYRKDIADEKERLQGLRQPAGHLSDIRPPDKDIDKTE